MYGPERYADLGHEKTSPALRRPADSQGVQRGERNPVEAALRDPETEGGPRVAPPRQEQWREDGEDRGEEEAAAVNPLSPDHIRQPPADNHGADLPRRRAISFI